MFSAGILVFDDVELLDFSVPYQVFSAAARIQAAMPGGGRPFRCHLMAPAMKPVRARGGLKVLPDCVLVADAELDILIVPGGDVTALLPDAVLAAWLRRQAGGARAVVGIGDGLRLLGKAGLGGGCRARAAIPGGDYGKVTSTAGVAGALDLCLRLVARLCGQPLALATADDLHYQWSEDGVDKDAGQAAARLSAAA